MPRVLISGYYGFGNLGDEALLEVMLERVRARFPSARLEVLSASPQVTASQHRVETVPRWEWREVRSAIGRSDVIVSGGGGLLQNATSTRSLLYYAGILREAIRRRRKTMLFAQSVGPLDYWGRLIVRQFCKGLDRATVRDERSQRLLHELLPSTPIEQTADPVFLYDEADEAVDLSGEGLGPESGPYAIVSIRKAAALRDAPSAVARAVDRLGRDHGIRAAFLPLGGAADAAASTDVIRLCTSNPVLLPECTLRTAASILRGAHVVVAMRLHALILAARYAVPFMAIAYDPKVSALCEDLAYPLAPLYGDGKRPADGAVDDLADRLVRDRDPLAAHLARRRSALETAAERNFDVLGELL
ncbi:MAG TPA: polysaccharide pyruvyl transferase CsaB [Candidatus Cybelea sp.]|nr:polysaccharide pyruvyl transferase CsaB [Candidatus Cybelea sp.]